MNGFDRLEKTRLEKFRFAERNNSASRS